MKNMKKIVAIVLLAAMAFTLISCSSFNSIKKAFIDNGYTYIDNADSEDNDDAKQANTITAELEENEISCTVHMFKTTTKIIVDIPVYALVLEFNSEKDLTEAIENSETIKGLIKDSQESDYINGNCLLVPLSLTKYEEMIEIFKNK